MTERTPDEHPKPVVPIDGKCQGLACSSCWPDDPTIEDGSPCLLDFNHAGCCR